MATCKERVMTGAVLGSVVGVSMGALFGGFNAFRFGLRGRPFLSAVGQAMLQMGGTFGFVMSVGSGLRCEEPATAAAASSSGANAPLSAIARAHRPMVQRDD